MNPIEKYNKRVDKANSLVCVGLDSDFEKLSARFKKQEHPQFAFNKWVIEETSEHVSAYKPNLAFYEARGDQGWRELKMTMEYLRKYHPDIFTIGDAKRADIGSTNKGYASAIFDWFGFDAITLHPYLGHAALQPFLDRKDKGCIILCRTSNPGAGEFQDLKVNGKPLWEVVASAVSRKWNQNGNCMLVVGATYPKEMKRIRELAPTMTFLVPGVGAQGGDIKTVMEAGRNENGGGLIINSSRGIIFADNPSQAAENAKKEINKYRF